MLIAGVCCLVIFQEAKADVNTFTDLSYYEPTDSIRVTATTYFDYATWCYYDVNHWGQVSNNNEVLGMFSATMYDGLDAYNEEYYPFDPNEEYYVEAYPNLFAKVRHDYGDTYEDYYQYVLWTYSDPALSFPNFFGFTGPGPDVEISGNSILLGAINSIFTEGAMSGPPHHLKINKDDFKELSGGCGQRERDIDYLVVDQSGRKAGKVAAGEDFGGTITNWCTNNRVDPQSCSWFSGGVVHPFHTDSSTIHDHLAVGCPAPDDSCGFSINPDTWVWCKPPGYTSDRIPLVKVTYDVRKRTITVGGRPTAWRKGTEIFANGQIVEPPGP